MKEYETNKLPIAMSYQRERRPQTLKHQLLQLLETHSSIHSQRITSRSLETTREPKEEQRNLRSTDSQAPRPLRNQSPRSQQPRSTSDSTEQAYPTTHPPPSRRDLVRERGKTSPSRDPFTNRIHHDRRGDRPQVSPQTTIDHQI
ncbi:unnamed protein product [Eruca vesicaria subsp. sativa]|uniref:Uncharacterized protein n=1 Tax=Eruca vesicaria subsp. sativa TaxID=29727 RepID=A0ABC8IN93_ERUVS|nr:unnamed protein product [Eruca vesicaria subsp. sativa]